MYKNLILLTLVTIVYCQNLVGNYGIFRPAPVPATPAPTPATTCASCNGYGEVCQAFSLGCSRLGCCGNLICQTDPTIADAGGICIDPPACPKCQPKNQRCQVFSNTCTQNNCCTGLVCNQTNPNVPDLGGVCEKPKTSCPECNSLGSKCLVSHHSWPHKCDRNKCCPFAICVVNQKHPMAGGTCQPILP